MNQKIKTTDKWPKKSGAYKTKEGYIVIVGQKSFTTKHSVKKFIVNYKHS